MKKYSYRQKVKTARDKAVVVLASLIMIANGTGLSIPLILTDQTQAAPNTTYSATGFGAYSWITDRWTPSGGHSLAGDSLTLNVDNTSNFSPSTGHARTEGLQTDFHSPVTSIKADLFVSSDWTDKPTRAGLWGKGNGWPIIEYVNNISSSPGHTGWRIWDTNSPGGWHPIIGAVTTNKSYNLEIAVNVYSSNYEYYIDNTLVGTLPLTNTATGLTGAIFNNFNSATLSSADNYSVTWSNFAVGTRTPNSPTGISFIKNGTHLASGSSVNYKDGIALQWGRINNADRYRITITHPDGTTVNWQPSRTANWNPETWTFQLHHSAYSDGHQRNGFFGERGQGTYTYTLAAHDATTGKWSAESAPHTLAYSTTPTAILTQDSDGSNIPHQGFTNSRYFTYSLTSAPTTTRYQLKYWNDIPSSQFKINTPWAPTNLSGHSPSLGTYKDNFTQGEGVHYFSFSACDAEDNCSNFSEPFVVTYDKTRPTVSIDNLEITGNTLSITTSGTDERSGLLALGVNIYNQTNTGPTLISGLGRIKDHIPALTLSDTASRTNVDISSLAPGTYTLRAVSLDHADNYSTQALRTFVVPEPSIEAPIVVIPAAITKPANNGEVLATFDNITLEAHDQASANGTVQWAIRSSTCAPNTNTIFGNVDGLSTTYSWINGQFIAEISNLTAGEYCFVFNPQNGTRLTRTFTVSNTVQGDRDCDGDQISDEDCDDSTGDGNSSVNPDDDKKPLDLVSNTQGVLGLATSNTSDILGSSTDGLTNTGTQNGGLVVLAALGILTLSAAALRKKNN